MGAREDYMTMRRAANLMSGATEPEELATAALLRAASAGETAFIRLAKAGIQNEVVDLAWALIGEPRPGGPAVASVGESTGG